MADKLKLAFYWGAACGGCEVAVLDLNDYLVEMGKIADIVIWPVAVDSKYNDVRRMDDQSIDVAFVNGAVRNEDNLEMARLLRAKSRLVVAFGSCAQMGGIPGLANLSTREEIFQRVYADNAANPHDIRPQLDTQVREGSLELPAFHNTVRPLLDAIVVDYFVPGCPPTPATVLAAITAIAEGPLPKRGSVLGAGHRTVCSECTRVKEEKKVREFKRVAWNVPDTERCLLEQGFVCLGSVTRDGCGALCLKGNMGCRGCFGAPDDVPDQGARFLSALATIVDSNDPAEIRAILGKLPDPVGYAYRFSLPASLMKRKVQQITVAEVAQP